MLLLNHLHFYCVHFLQDKKNAELGHALHCQCNVFSFFSFVSFIFRLCEKPQGKLYKVGVNKIDLNCKVCLLNESYSIIDVYHFLGKFFPFFAALHPLFSLSTFLKVFLLKASLMDLFLKLLLVTGLFTTLCKVYHGRSIWFKNPVENFQACFNSNIGIFCHTTFSLLFVFLVAHLTRKDINWIYIPITYLQKAIMMRYKRGHKIFTFSTQN